MTERDPHHEQWLDGLGPMSWRMRDTVRQLMGDWWMLDGRNDWMLRFRCYADATDQKILTLYRTPTGGFTGARFEIIHPAGRARSWADVDEWIAS